MQCLCGHCILFTIRFRALSWATSYVFKPYFPSDFLRPREDGKSAGKWWLYHLPLPQLYGIEGVKLGSSFKVERISCIEFNLDR